jgi:spermidine/putrescine transport system ATP-binding protein
VADFIGETNFLDGVVQEQEGDLATVLVDGALPIVAQTPDSLQPGTAVTVAVRPEKISLATGAAPDGQNAFPGRVEQVVYVGTDTRYRVRLSDNVALVVREQNIVSTTDPVSHYMNNDRPVQARWQYTGGRILLD